MASGKIPKLVIKRHHTTSRKLKLPDEIAAEQQEGILSNRTSRITRHTVMIRQAKASLRSHLHLIAIGLCAALVMYGVAVSLTSEGKTSAGTGEIDENGQIESENRVMMVPVKDNPGIFKRITINNVTGTKTELFRVEKRGDVTLYIPWKPPKRKKVVPTYEQQQEQQVTTGTIPQ